MEYSGDGLYTVEVSPLRLPFTFQPNDILVHPTFIPRKGDPLHPYVLLQYETLKGPLRRNGLGTVAFAIRCNGSAWSWKDGPFLRQSVHGRLTPGTAPASAL